VLAFNVHVYDTLKFLHIAAAISWVGSGLFVQYRGTRLRRAGTPEQMTTLAREVAESTPFFIVASVSVFVFGAAMVAYSPIYNFTDTWILLGLAGYIATFITGNFVIRPTVEKLAGALETEDPSSPAVQALVTRLFAVSRVDQVVLLLVVANMVFKPGA
jgi:uncharacterized membrane protein